jgi:hypothetical protein
MICESMLSVSQDGLLREMLLSKYRLQIFDYIYIYIYTISNTSSFEINLPTTQIYRVWGMQSTGKCLKSNKVFTTQCFALKIKDRT